jgi:hypothetical protein
MVLSGKANHNKRVGLDGHPKYQKALDFKVNVFAVNKGLQIGQPTQIKIKAKKG